MLKSHMDANERALLATSRIPANSGHSLHKGTPREAFIKDFLTDHLSERVAIGTGEIIDADSKPGEQRNQIDVVIYKRDYPRLHFGGGVTGFLAESVVSTVEVKSVLDEEEFRKAYLTARKTKGLKKSLATSYSAGYLPPSILSYIVAYDGPASLKTVYRWVQKLHKSEGIQAPSMGASEKERLAATSPGLDGVFILGRGFLYFDNTPVGFLTDEIRKERPNTRWVYTNSKDGNLLLLFLFLSVAVSGMSGSWLNPLPYLSRITLGRCSVGD